jgi:integrase
LLAATTTALGEKLGRTHLCRVTFNSRLAEDPDVELGTRQLLMRHANPTITLNSYTRVRGDEAARLERMRRALGG